MPHSVDVPDIGAEYLLLRSCRDRLNESDDSCLPEVERLARESPYEGVRASAQEILRQYRETQTRKVNNGDTTRY